MCGGFVTQISPVFFFLDVMSTHKCTRDPRTKLEADRVVISSFLLAI